MENAFISMGQARDALSPEALKHGYTVEVAFIDNGLRFLSNTDDKLVVFLSREHVMKGVEHFIGLLPWSLSPINEVN